MHSNVHSRLTCRRANRRGHCCLRLSYVRLRFAWIRATADAIVSETSVAVAASSTRNSARAGSYAGSKSTVTAPPLARHLVSLDGPANNEDMTRIHKTSVRTRMRVSELSMPVFVCGPKFTHDNAPARARVCVQVCARIVKHTCQEGTSPAHAWIEHRE